MRRAFREKGVPIVMHIGVSCVILILVVSLTFLTGYKVFSDHVTHANLNYTTQVFRQLQNQLQSRIQNLEDSLHGLAVNRTTATFVRKRFWENPFQASRDIDSLTLNVMMINPDVRQIVIEGENGALYFAVSHDQALMDALEQLPDRPQMDYVLSAELKVARDKTDCFLLSTSMCDIWNYTTDFFLGRITMVVELEALGLENFSDQYGMGLYLINEEGVYSSNRKHDAAAGEIFSELDVLEMQGQREIAVQGKPYLVFSSRIDKLNSSLVSILPKENITKELEQITRTGILLMAAAVLLMTAVMLWLNRKLNDPLYQLIGHMRSIQDDKKKYFGKELHLSGYREIREVSAEFNRMIQKVGSLTDDLLQTNTRLYESQLQKKQTELLQLRSQINPHFLYNTLESLIGMAYLEEAEQTAGMTKDLARIFKYSVKGEDLVMVRSELQVIEAYLSIQLKRFSGVFEVVYQFEPDALECFMPKMLLQPLVENSIAHGFRELLHGGRLTVGGRREGEQLLLWVEDNGEGFSEQRLDYFRTLIDGGTLPSSDSIGLENVIVRLRLMYGERGSFQIESHRNEGTRIDIHLPLEQEV